MHKTPALLQRSARRLQRDKSAVELSLLHSLFLFDFILSNGFYWIFFNLPVGLLLKSPPLWIVSTLFRTSSLLTVIFCRHRKFTFKRKHFNCTFVNFKIMATGCDSGTTCDVIIYTWEINIFSRFFWFPSYMAQKVKWAQNLQKCEKIYKSHSNAVTLNEYLENIKNVYLFTKRLCKSCTSFFSQLRKFS